MTLAMWFFAASGYVLLGAISFALLGVSDRLREIRDELRQLRVNVNDVR